MQLDLNKLKLYFLLVYSLKKIPILQTYHSVKFPDLVGLPERRLQCDAEED